MGAKLLAAGGLTPTEMNAGRSEALMKPSEYCSVGFANGMCFPSSGGCVLAGGKPLNEARAWLRTWCNGSATKDVMNEVGRRK
jgi:hypothetical protein